MASGTCDRGLDELGLILGSYWSNGTTDDWFGQGSWVAILVAATILTGILQILFGVLKLGSPNEVCTLVL
jgi:MFS superfamily sulfate permease-like transporter